MLFRDYIVIDNLFPDLERIKSFSSQVEYYDKDQFSEKYSIPKLYFKGKRSNRIIDLNKQLGEEINKTIISSVLNNTLGELISLHNIDINVNINTFFHYSTSEDQYIDNDPSWVHKDGTLFSGIIHLSNNTPTYMFINGERLEIDGNKNRLLMFNSTISHSPSNGLGSSFDTSRRTIVFTVEKFTMNMYINSLQSLPSAGRGG